MKILVLSDSHGNTDNMRLAVLAARPDMTIHLGDCWADAEKLAAMFPEIPLEQVAGNCDFRPGAPLEKLLELGGKRVLVCHGHAYGVKDGLLGAGYAAEEKRADVFLFGHTHRPFLERRGSALFMNPGSVGEWRSPSYGVLTIENGSASGELFAAGPLPPR